jgi:hypothetical protein
VGAVAMLALAGAADAATMTWDDPGLGATSYTEDGIAVTGDGDLAFLGLPGHLHPGGNEAVASKLTFTMDTRFDAVSLLLDPWGFHYTICEGESGERILQTYKN